MYNFPSSNSNQMSILVEAMVFITTNNSREIFMTILDPYAKINSPDFTKGSPGTVTSGNSYIEDLGPSQDSNGNGHLVVVNDTRITIDDAYSMHPSIAIDSSGKTHLAWMDARDYGFEKDDNYEIYYNRLRLRGAANWDGVPGGLPTYGIKQIVDTKISHVEGKFNIPTNRPWGPSSTYPAILTDSQDNVHIAYLDNANATAGEEIMYVRMNATKGEFPLNSIASSVIDPWEPVSITDWASDKLGPNSGRSPELGQSPGFANDMGSGAHVAWSDTNKCKPNDSNGNSYTLCYTHVLTGQVDVFLAPGETYYHVIEPGEQTMYNLTLNNTTPGPTDLVADTFSANLSGVPQNWTATLFFSSNHTAIFPDTPIFLKGGEWVPLYLRVRAPSIYQADGDELASIIISAVSHKDPAIRSDRLTLTLMDVVHGIALDTSHSMADVEQGQTAIFSISIENTGNVHDTFAFYDPNTLEGQQEWLLPFGWQVVFPLAVSLDPKQAVTKNLEISIPTSQDPGTFVIYVKGWSTGEPIKSIEKGTYDVLELWVNVSIRSTGNIVFEIYDTSEYVLPGECTQYDIDVIKHFSPGFLVFSTPGAPEARPDETPENIWRFDHWTLSLDFTNAPGGNSVSINTPRRWEMDHPYTVTAIVCAPYNASAGLGPAVTIKAYLEGASRVSDSVVLSTNVIHVYELDATLAEDEYAVDPGDRLAVSVNVQNDGNGPDRYDMRVVSIRDADGSERNWHVDVPRGLLEELHRSDSQTLDVIVNVPGEVTAGDYEVEVQVFSEEAYEGTRLRDTFILKIHVNEFHDMQIELDPFVESAVKTTAPGRTVRYVLNVTNNGNIEDTPTLHNHTTNPASGTFDEEPGMGILEKWNVRWAMVEGFDTELPQEIPCVELAPGDEAPTDTCAYHADGTWSLPPMAAYTTYNVVAIVDISPQASLANRELGLKVLSHYGSAADGGDTDETATWSDHESDTNEQVVTIRLRAPNLVIVGVSVGLRSEEVGGMIPVTVAILNDGNVHATDINVILCEKQSLKDIRRNGCDEENVAYRQVIGALMPPDAADRAEPAEIVLLYPVSAGSHNVVVVVDPDNEIVEANEADNYEDVSGTLSSNNPMWDVAAEVLGAWSVPALIVLLTLSLLSVAGFVMYGRRKEALGRVAEQSSLMQSSEERF